MSMFDRRGCALMEGELEFAGWQEAVDLDDPFSILEEQERVSLARRRECAEAALELAEELRDVYCIRLFSRVLKETEAAWQEAGGGVSYLSLAEATGENEELAAQQLRLEHYRTFCRYIAQGAEKRDLASLVRNFLAMARRVMPELVAGISGVEMAALLGEDKQATQARESRVVEEFQRRNGVKAYKGLGKTASDEARARMAASATGNKHRATAAERRKQEAADVLADDRPAAKKGKAPAKPKKKAAKKLATKAAKRFMERKGEFALVSAQTGEKRPVAGLKEAREAWLTGGMKASGTTHEEAWRTCKANHGLIYEAGRLVARIDYQGNITYPKGGIISAV